MNAHCVIFLAVAASAAFALSGCCCPKQSPEKIAAMEADLKDAMDGLRAIAKDVPSPKKMRKLKAIACPDEALAELRPKSKPVLYAKTADYEDLRLLTRDPDKNVERKRKQKRWAWMTWDRIGMLELQQQGKRAPKRPNDIRWLMGHVESRHLVVFRASSKKNRAMPEVTDDPTSRLRKRATAVRGEHFSSGRYKGWLFVYDRETQERICQAPIEATSGEVLKYRTRGIAQTTTERAIEDDFKSRFKEAAGDSLGAISEILAITF